MHRMSPAVERAMAMARTLARESRQPLGLNHLALALLLEDDGRPAVLLERAGLSVAEVRVRLSEISGVFTSPDESILFSAARNWSLAHRHDPEFLTDALFLTVLRADEAFGTEAARLGLDAARLEAVLKDHEPPALPSSDSTPDRLTITQPGEHWEADTTRILDANLNRAREAARVVEDYCRFALNDRILTEELKAIRHALANLSARIPVQGLLAARDTVHDVGTTVTAPGEYTRDGPSDVATVNLKRLQESLRCLEEFGKSLAPDLGREFEKLRYRSYTLERAVRNQSDSRERLARARLYLLVTSTQCRASWDQAIRGAIRGGVDIIQLREKTLSDRELICRARTVRQWTREAGVLFIVNDRPDIARIVGADGVHLGQDDLSVDEARRILGPQALIGVSTHSIDQVRQAILAGADYLGIGPVFPSRTKSFDHYPGLDFVRESTAETPMPSFAIGGIGPDNLERVVAAGAKRVAVGSAVLESDDPESLVRLLKARLPV